MLLSTPILITGASGFVGANLLRKMVRSYPPKYIHVLLRKNFQTWRIEDLLKQTSNHVVRLYNYKETNDLVRKIKPKTIFHLATHGAYPHQQKEEEKIISANIVGTCNLMRACARIGCDSFVNVGSSSEYGSKATPMKEADALHPTTPYGVSKAWATLYGEYLALDAEMPITTVRLFSVYGFYEPRGRLIPNVILSLIRGKSPTLAAPTIVRDFVFINDVIEAFMLVAKRSCAMGIFNIGSGKQSTIEEVFEIIKNLVHSKARPQWDKVVGRSFDTDKWVADIHRAKTQLKWEPKTSLESGLMQTVHWIQKNISLYE